MVLSLKTAILSEMVLCIGNYVI